MSSHKIDRRAYRKNARRVDRFVTGIVVIFDVLHIDGIAHQSYNNIRCLSKVEESGVTG